MTEASTIRHYRYRFPAEIIAHAVWLYDRFPLSLRDVEDLLAERGIDVSFQTVSGRWGSNSLTRSGGIHAVTLQTRGRLMRWW